MNHMNHKSSPGYNKSVNKQAIDVKFRRYLHTTNKTVKKNSKFKRARENLNKLLIWYWNC